jgi:hypothetical protein
MNAQKLWILSISSLLIVFGSCTEKAPSEPETVFDPYYNPVIDSTSFTNAITNPYWPVTVGRRWTYVGTDAGIAESVSVVVDTSTKVILGVTCAVVRDMVYKNGSLVEDTYDWYAQDAGGNVWYFGEDSKEMANGSVVSTEGSWESGVNGAKPGIVMFADPQPGLIYRQEYLFEEAEDWAQVVSVLDTCTIGLGKFDEVVKTEEWTPLDPGIKECKYYALGIGLIKEEVISGGSGSMELVFSNTPPDPPVPISPAGIDVATNPRAFWHASRRAASYNLQLSSSDAFTSFLVNQTGMADTMYVITNLTNSTTYYWRVSAANTYGTSGWSSVFTFTTVAP